MESQKKKKYTGHESRASKRTGRERSTSPLILTQNLMVVLDKIEVKHDTKKRQFNSERERSCSISPLPEKRGKLEEDFRDGSMIEFLQNQPGPSNEVKSKRDSQDDSLIKVRQNKPRFSYEELEDYEEDVTSGSEYNPELDDVAEESESNDGTNSDDSEYLFSNSKKDKDQAQITIKKSLTSNSNQSSVKSKTTETDCLSPPSKDLDTTNEANISADSRFNLSINLESVGDAIKNRKTAELLDSKCGSKKYACIFCVEKKLEGKEIQVLYTKLHSHFVNKHSDKKEIKEYKSFDLSKYEGEEKKIQAAKKRSIIDYLREKGNALNNLKTNDSKDFVVVRRPRKAGKTISTYANCLKCKRYFSSTSLRKHVVKCTGHSFLHKHEVQTLAKTVEGNYHRIATPEAITVAAKIRDNDVHDAIRHDYSIILWLNAEARRRETTKHHFEKVRANLCRFGRLKIEMKKMHESIDDLSDIFNEQYYDDFIKAVKVLGKADKKTKYLLAPATASDVGTLVKDLAEVYYVDLGNKKENEIKRTQITNFLLKHKVMWIRDIGNTIAESQARIKRNKKEIIPIQDDTKKLRIYLETEMATSFHALSGKYSDIQYTSLRNAIGVYLQVTNCRRAGEVERLEMDVLNTIEKNNGKCRIEVRGKRTRPVPIIFDDIIHKYINLLVSKRTDARISEDNPYFFANIMDLNRNFTHIRLNKIISEFADKCGAVVPHTLRGTKVRKQVATHGAKEGLHQRAVGNLSEYLGHTEKIHRSNYRTLNFERDLETIQHIEKAQGIMDSNSHAFQMTDDGYEGANNENFHIKNTPKNIKYKEKPVRHEDNSPNAEPENEIGSEEEQENELKQRTQVNEKKNSRHRNYNLHHKKKIWLREDISDLLEAFPNALNLEHKLPSSDQIIAFQLKTKNENLASRSEPQIRSWFHAERKKIKIDQSAKARPQERNTIPTYIYSAFGKYINAGKEPPLKTCSKFLISSPSLMENVTIANILKWVREAIARKNKPVS